MTTKEAYEHLKNELKNHPDYAWTWHSSIAMAIFDAESDISLIDSNIAAAHVMSRCFGVDTAKSPFYGFDKT